MSDINVLHETSIPKVMRAIALEQPNKQINLVEIEIPVPVCGDNELLVKVESVSLSPRDATFAKVGFCKRWQFPHVLGIDAVGIVVKTNKGIFPAVGQRVMWHANIDGPGVLSEYTKVPNFAVSVVPPTITANEAATLPCAGMTALIALDKLQIVDGSTILIEAGAGAVGQFAIQFAKQRGADVFTTASKRNHKLVKKLGADAIFDYKDKKLCEKISRELGAQGVDAVLDSVGGESTIRNIELMRFSGRIACLKPLPIFEQQLLDRKAPNIGIISLCGAWLDNSLCAQQKMSFMGNLLLDCVAKGEIEIPAISLVDFTAESVSVALHKQLDGGFTGKQVVQIST
jgi:NADPH:quinone reductase-like Zn-dependent oxidoreductase